MKSVLSAWVRCPSGSIIANPPPRLLDLGSVKTGTKKRLKWLSIVKISEAFYKIKYGVVKNEFAIQLYGRASVFKV